MPELDTSSKTYEGQCHCGAVRYTAEADLTGLADCNCSRCRRLGWVLKSVPADKFKLLSGADNLTLYHFNTDKIDHLFCKTCGIAPFSRGRFGDTPMVMLNVGCLEDTPMIDRSTITHYNGAGN